MDDLFQIIIFVAIGLIAMLGSTKKKAGPRVRRPPPRPVPEQPPDPGGLQEATPPASEREVAVRDLLDLLQGRTPAPRPVTLPEPEPEPTASLEVVESEAQSIESLDPEGSPSYRAFHEHFVEHDRTPEPMAMERATTSVVRRLTPRTAREAVIWKAIFDKPKGFI